VQLAPAFGDGIPALRLFDPFAEPSPRYADIPAERLEVAWQYFKGDSEYQIALRMHLGDRYRISGDRLSFPDTDRETGGLVLRTFRIEPGLELAHAGTMAIPRQATGSGTPTGKGSSFITAG